METRKDEQTIRVENASELESVNRTDFCYTAETVLQKWTEDFVNEDNGQTVSVERSHLLYPKGEHLDFDDFSALLFHFQSGDIKEVVLSNQQRRASIVEKSSWGVWEVKVSG